MSSRPPPAIKPPAPPIIALAGDAGLQPGPRAFTLAHVRLVADLVRQVAEAAHALHGAGVVHRDIKPGNIMLTPEGRAVLMDLGTAQFETEATMTERGNQYFQGTARYCSPEQLRNLAKVDARGDVYSLGATLWELLTLQPFLGITRETPLREIFERVEQMEPESPAAANPLVPCATWLRLC